MTTSSATRCLACVLVLQGACFDPKDPVTPGESDTDTSATGSGGTATSSSAATETDLPSTSSTTRGTTGEADTSETTGEEAGETSTGDETTAGEVSSSETSGELSTGESSSTNACGVEDGDPCDCPPNRYGVTCEIYFDEIDLPVGHNQGSVTAVSRDGTTVVGSSRGTLTNTVAMRWRDGTSESLGVLAADQDTVANAVSGDGSVVVGDAELTGASSGSVVTVGFIWDGTLDDLPLPAYGTFAHALDISSDGSLIVGWGDSDGEHRALHWVNEGVETVPSVDPLFFESVSPDGTVIGGTISSGSRPRSPIVWSSETTVLDGLEGYSGGVVLASSTDGSVRAGYVQEDDGTDELPVRWIGTSVAEIVGPERLHGRALGISGDGNTIVGSAGNEAFLCRNGTDATPTMERLAALLADAGVDLTSWTLTEAVDVSADGLTIVGNARRGSVETPWILRLPAP